MISRSFVAVDHGVQCHASTVAVALGHPVVAWFAGTREGTPDNRIHIAGPSGIQVLDTGRDAAHWNPVLAPGPDGALWLFCKVGARISEWITLGTRSHDGGATWEAVRELVPGGVVTSGAGEYPYPTAVVDGDRLLVTYTWQRRGIVLAEVPLADLMP